MQSSRSISVVLTLLISACVSFKTQAQMPGSWEKIAISRTWAPVSITFSDSLHGIILADSASRLSVLRSFSTTDGGQSWRQPTDYPTIGSPINLAYHPVTTVGKAQFDLFGMSALYPGQRSFDGGITWIPNPEYPFSGNVIGCRMFDASNGYVLVESGQLVTMYMTLDSGNTFTTEIGSGVPAFGKDVYIADSLQLWVSANGLSGNNHGGILFSSDAGQTWGIRYPVDTSKYYFTYFEQLVPCPNPDFLYMLGGGESKIGSQYQVNIDFVKSTDAGKNWMSDSTLGGGRISRMCAPSVGTLWAFVSSKIYGGSSNLAKDPTIHGFADTLCYSSDNGETWIKDSKTFIGDTLTDMYWPDSTHGYITAWRDSTMYVYRFIPNSEGVAESGLESTSVAITLRASPVTNTLSISTTGFTGSVKFQIVDLLGCARLIENREVISARQEKLDFDVKTLPGGYYMLSVTSPSGLKATRGFIKE